MDNMNKSLDEIMKSRPRNRHSSGRNARAKVLGNTTATVTPAARQRIKATKVAPAQPAAATAQQPADKIIVSNLPQDVNEQQVKELFHTTVGPLRDVTLHYDSAGRSKGVAAVHFQRKGDGTKAFQQYNNRLIDGKRPMKIEIVVDPTRAAPGPSLAARVAPATEAIAQPNGTRNATRGGARRGRGRGGRTRKNDRPNKSAADLDAEMEDYTSSTAPAVPAAAA
ncbi:hypothetical protein DFH05DRAFT_1486684 [Lentinula detonsa]|uniref:RRM domain-containing protein n=2 Tax=Lentinula TaxID=5352 RepID=A0AA38KY22_9AGAR|nr:hypothetical protein DFH05DRAFT_1486684 [Lentinula detonsa]KAJ3788517.1 hypothetical protein GGU10DRAFT_346070 [Lentinula aff. detonsa]